MNKGIIMEIKGRRVIVLTSKGVFCSIPKEATWRIGQEIALPAPESKTKLKLGVGKKVVSILALSLAIFLALIALFHLLPIGVDAETKAYICIELNPNLELNINQSLRVIAIEAMNEDGQILLSSLTGWKHKKLEEVMKQLLRMAAEQGYLHKESQVLITTSFVSDDDQKYEQLVSDQIKELESQLNYDVKQVLSEAQDEPVEERSITFLQYQFYIEESDLQLARENGTSIGKILMYQRVVEQGANLSIEQLQELSIMQLLEYEKK